MPTESELAAQNLAAQNKALLRRHFDAINRWDFADMREYFHPDITLELPFVVDPFPKSVSGFDEVMAFMESVPDFAEAENLHDFTINSFAEDPNELLAEYRSDMKLKSGNEYKNSYVVRATIKDGKLFLFREYFDGIRLLEALDGRVVMPGTD
jgi:ketosteroid isomerase-like protein